VISNTHCLQKERARRAKLREATVKQAPRAKPMNPSLPERVAVEKVPANEVEQAALEGPKQEQPALEGPKQEQPEHLEVAAKAVSRTRLQRSRVAVSSRARWPARETRRRSPSSVTTVSGSSAARATATRTAIA
jgi:hypothetical protein